MPHPVEQRLREAGLRVTAPRVAVLRALDAARDHPSVDQIIARVHDAGTPVSVQGAYAACEALMRAGLARRIEPAGGPARYESRVGDNHHHLVCRACGAAADVDCAVGRTVCMEPSDARGFRLDEVEVVFWGLCPDCQQTIDERNPA